MDPCPFVRLTVGNLALKIPVASKSDRSVVHPSSSPCYCKIKLKNFPLQTAVVLSFNQIATPPTRNCSPNKLLVFT
ncbi:unnamed protein product [Rhodiola kirilowii]